MKKPNITDYKKQICLTAVGVTLQMLGSACLIAATLGAVIRINEQIKQALVEKLSK